MRISPDERKQLDDLRQENSTPGMVDKLVDFLVDKAPALSLQELLVNTGYAAIPRQAFETYVDETVKSLCGPRAQNRRTLQVLAHMLVLTQFAASRLYADSGEQSDLQTLQTRTNLALALTAETRRLVAAIEGHRQEIEGSRSDQFRVVEPVKASREKKVGSKSKVASNAKGSR